MVKVQEVLKKVKEVLKPTENIRAGIDAFIHSINQSLNKKQIEAVCVAGGSVAKDTFLKHDYDVDLFVRFKLYYKDKDISQILESVLPKNAERVHGSRDYFQIKQDGFTYELVPVLAVEKSEDAVNVTDMSPLHVDWVQKHTSKKPELKDEIRLAKQFCKAAKVYGAESFIKGFSGHILDILIIHYGSFLKLLKAATKWKAPLVIDVEKHLKNPLKELNSSKTQSPLIIVDPLQKDRNAAAALSIEKFEQFKESVACFMKDPSESFFNIIPLTEGAVKQLHRDHYPKDNLFLFTIHPKKGKRDVIGSKVLKVFESFQRNLNEYEFNVRASFWEFGNPCLLYFIIDSKPLSKTHEIKGPPVKEEEHAQKFNDKHKEVKEKDGFLVATEPRTYVTPDELFKDLMHSPFIKERVKKISLE